MKPIRLFTSLLAVATVALASCSVPRLAQEDNSTDDVYNSVAQAQVYTPPAPKQSAQYKDTSSYDDDYVTSDPYYDMDYSSRINRFYYGSPFRGYYDPFYYDYYGYNGFSPWYGPGLSMSFGWGWGNSYFNNYLHNPYFGWGIYSPYYAWSPFYGGGYLGGGYYGGGYYGGGYGGRVNALPGTTTYGPRPDRSGNRGSSGIVSTDRSRTDRYNPNRSNTTNRNAGGRASRPSGESYRPPTRSNTDNRPSYTPPPTRSNPPSAPSGGSGGGGSRSPRSGGRN
jgi:hypothetical protein